MSKLHPTRLGHHHSFVAGRVLGLAPVLALAACASQASAPAPTRRPEVAVVKNLPAGAVLVSSTADLSDELPWRAAGTLWHEALRQSTRFTVLERAPAERPLPCVQLQIDRNSYRLAAFLVPVAGATVPLGGELCTDADLQDAGGMAAAIDRLARTTREALGEITATPVSCVASVGRDPGFVDAAADAWRMLGDGAIEGAWRLFTRTRARDGGSPFVLDGLAQTELLRGHAAVAERIAHEALGFTARLAPHHQHCLARTLLLARASQQPQRAPDRDRELLQLGQVFARERPHDPEALLTLGLAHNFLGDFAAAQQHLTALLALQPERALAHYHLGWSLLAQGQAVAAVPEFEAAALRLPAASLIVPMSIALYHAQQHDRLRAHLEELGSELAARDSLQLHDLRRMQAAHALLLHDDATAVRILLEDLNWLLGHPSALGDRAGELAETGIVLVRLGAARSLPPVLAALQQQRPGSSIADAVAFLTGLVSVVDTGQRAQAVERILGRGGDSIFGLLLQALAHERRGELGDQHNALARAARLGDSPLVKMLLARSLQSMGRTAEGELLLSTLRAELLAVQLRQRARHPLLGPELAFACR